jgi:hypothetical protein
VDLAILCLSSSGSPAHYQVDESNELWKTLCRTYAEGKEDNMKRTVKTITADVRVKNSNHYW